MVTIGKLQRTALKSNFSSNFNLALKFWNVCEGGSKNHIAFNLQRTAAVALRNAELETFFPWKVLLKQFKFIPGHQNRVTDHQGKGQFAGYCPHRSYGTVTHIRHIRLVVVRNDIVLLWLKDVTSSDLFYLLAALHFRALRWQPRQGKGRARTLLCGCSARPSPATAQTGENQTTKRAAICYK